MDNEKAYTDVDRRKEAESQKESSFVFSESMFDDYCQWLEMGLQDKTKTVEGKYSR